ncbi:MAG: GNAT family N-acetyltransferase [Candidatus Caenarcaniphilales bacterium]|nr:GNAT family N-acetyltransferase [Candidatus Caenarcaniphilales bacterium]
MKLRPANIDDITSLMYLQENIIEYERSFDTAIRNDTIYYPEHKIKEIIEEDMGIVLVLENEGKLFGCGFGTVADAEGWDAYKQKGYLGMMYVAPSFRGQGFGKQIINYLIEWFEKKGILDIQLNVYPQNINAMKLYQSFGFTEHLLYMRRLKSRPVK